MGLEVFFNLFWLLKKIRETLKIILNVNFLKFCALAKNFKILKKIAKHMEISSSTTVYRGTQVEEHWIWGCS